MTLDYEKSCVKMIYVRLFVDKVTIEYFSNSWQRKIFKNYTFTFRRNYQMAKWVYLFKEGNADMRNLLGGKGANLAEMTKMCIRDSLY